MFIIKYWKAILFSCVLGFGVITAFLYQSTSNELESLKTQYKSLQSDLSSLQSNYDTYKLTCSIQKDVIAQDCSSRIEVIENTNDLLSQIDNIPSRTEVRSTPTNESSENEEIDINTKLPSSLSRVLQQADSDYKNRTNPDK